MTSRERVRKALNHEEPDRVPVDLGSSYITSICVDAYADLVKTLGIDSRPKVVEPFQMLGEIDEKLMDVLGIDVVPVLPRALPRIITILRRARIGIISKTSSKRSGWIIERIR